jgi:hypothetical protein
MVIKRSRVFIKDLANRFGPLPMALAGGLILGLLTLTIPNSLIESVVSATGISELLSFAAPPLGIKARIAIALATALLVFGVLALLLVRDGDGEQNVVIANKPAEDLKFASDFEKEARQEAALANTKPLLASSKATARKPGVLDRVRAMMPVIRDASPEDVRELEDLPKLRREDRHPDAPPRAPLRAGRDLQDDFDNESLDNPDNKAPIAPDAKDSDGSTGKVANMRKRLSGLIPRDLMGDEDGGLDGTPLVTKKPLAAASSEPLASPAIDESPRNVADQTYAAPPIAEPVTAKPIAAADESEGIYLTDQPDPIKYEEPISYSDPLPVADAKGFEEQPVEAEPVEAEPVEAEPVKADIEPDNMPSEAPAPQKFAVVDNAIADSDDAVEPVKIRRHISAPLDELSLNALNLSELIDRLEQGLERLTENSGQDIAEKTRDDAPKANSEPSSRTHQDDIPASAAPAANAQPFVQEDKSFADTKPADTQSEAAQDVPQNTAPVAVKQEPQKANDSQPLTDPEDMDEALRAALETLRQMTGEQRNAS